MTAKSCDECGGSGFITLRDHTTGISTRKHCKCCNEERYPRCPDCGRIMGVSKSCVCGYYPEPEKSIGGLCWHTGCSNKVPHGTHYCPEHAPKENLVNEQEARDTMRSELSRMVDLTTGDAPKNYTEMNQRLWLAFHAGERYARAEDELHKVR